jgi:hypothetical protein
VYAQLIQGGAAPEDREQMNGVVVHEMLPALLREPGFSGALNLVEPGTGDAMTILLWETEAQARRALADYRAPFLKALASVMSMFRGRPAPISVWEVSARA